MFLLAYKRSGKLLLLFVSQLQPRERFALIPHYRFTVPFFFNQDMVTSLLDGVASQHTGLDWE